MSKKFDRELLGFHLPDTFKGLKKTYIMTMVFDERVQKAWNPFVGDIIVGKTGNVFVISATHNSSGSLGGRKFFFGGGLCSRDGGGIMDETFAFVMNADGMEYYYTDQGIKKRGNPYYSKISDFRFVPYPHEVQEFQEFKLNAIAY